MWRERYGEFGLAGLDDVERSGRPCVYDHDDVLLLVKLVTEEPPDGTTRWTMEALAEQMAAHGVPISASQCWRICSALDLKPWQVESWMTSHDPDFWEKAGDVCGLYLNPPENAVVWSVDEKSGHAGQVPGQPHQAGGARASRPGESSSTSATAPPCSSPPSTSTTAAVAGWVTDSTRSENFVAFLGDLVRPDARRARPALHRRQLHGARHRSGARVLGRPPPRAPALHADPRQLAQPGRAVLLHPRTPAAAPRRVRLGRRTSPNGSSPSSRTTTDEPHRSAGPTTAAHSWPRKSQ